VQNFQTEVTLPEWQLEPDEEAYYGDPDQPLSGDNEAAPQDQDMPDQGTTPDDTTAAPIPDDQPAPPPAPRRPPTADRPPTSTTRPPQIDQKWLDNVLKDQPRQPPH